MLDLDAAALLDRGRTVSDFAAVPVGDGSHDGDIRSFVVTLAWPIDLDGVRRLADMLLNRHGDKIFRVKGILTLAGETAPVAIHGVRYLVHNPVHMAAWPDQDRRSRIVFIVDGLDPGLIRRSLAAFNGLAYALGRMCVIRAAECRSVTLFRGLDIPSSNNGDRRSRR